MGLMFQGYSNCAVKTLFRICCLVHLFPFISMYSFSNREESTLDFNVTLYNYTPHGIFEDASPPRVTWR